MENREHVIFRGERGRFIKPPETLKLVENPVQATTEPSVYNVTHVSLDDRIQTVRQELSHIQQEVSITEPISPIEIHIPEPVVGEGLILGEKLLKAKQKEVKEKTPQSYKEKLLVVSDLQLLRETNEEGLGAFLLYVKDQGRTFTHIVLNGDIIDFTQQGGFRKDNQMGDAVTRDEQIAGRWFIDFMTKECPNAKKVFMKGNHEARYDNLYLDSNNGIQQYLRPFEEVFGLEDWEVHSYGKGDSYDWHGRKIRHGTRTGKQDIGKLEMQDNWRSNTLGHAIVNKMGEFVDADGNSFTTYLHAGFSQTADYDKTGNKTPSNGFGVYYYSEVKGTKIENAYQIIMPANNPRFISPEGTLYDGVGFNLRQEVGLDPKRGRGRFGKIIR